MSNEDATPQITADGLVTVRADKALAARAGVDDPHADWFVTEAGRRLAAMALTVDPPYAVYNLARFRHFGERLAEAAGRFEQVLLIGSGYDTRPWWMPELAGGRARIVEIDMPSTLAAKRSILAAHGVKTPASLTAVGADLDRADLAALLRGTGWRTELPSFVLIEGVFYYLRPETVGRLLTPATLGLVPGSVIAFDWWEDARTERLNKAVMARSAPRLFNPFPLRQEAGTVAAALRERGFEDVREAALDTIAREVWPPPHDWTTDSGWRVAEASVAPAGR